MDAKARAARIKLIAFDIDGVMTDGGLHYSDDGHEFKTFNVQDGLGIVLLKRVGIEVAIITGRNSGVVLCAAENLGVAHVSPGRRQQTRGGRKLLAKLGLDWSELAFMGDDLIDPPAMARALAIGLPMRPHRQGALRRHHQGEHGHAPCARPSNSS